MYALRYITTTLIILVTFGLQAQQAEFRATAPATVKAGQQFQYTIEGNQQGNIRLPDLDGFDLQGGPFTSFSSSTRWVNGKMTAENKASYIFVLKANQTGEFTIPAATVQVKKEMYKTNPVTVSVIPAAGGNASTPAFAGNTAGTPSASTGSNGSAGGDQPVFLRVIPSKRDVYVGEQLVSELKVYTSVNTRPAGGMKEVPYEGFYKYELEPDQASSRETIDGKVHVTQVLQRHVLIPQKAGNLVIEPFESQWTVPQRVKSNRSGNAFDDFFNDPFNDPFFDRVREVPVEISTKPVTIHVKPLPGDAPVGFTGGVGNLSFKARLTARNVKVNDALSLIVEISGTGNVALLGAPEVDFPPDHDIYETIKKPTVNTGGNRVSGKVIFEYPIVARHAGNFRIAPIRFAWFDPEAGKYRSVTTEEFNFTVEKGEDMDQGSEIYVPGTVGEDVKNISTDILDIRRSMPDFSKIDQSPLNHVLYWMIYLLLLILFVSSVIVLRVYYSRRADVKLMRNRKANKIARNRLRVADRARKAGDSDRFYEEIEKAVWGYLSDKLTIELSSLSREKVAEVLGDADADEEILQEMFRILDESEFSRYAPSAQKSEVDKLFNDTVRLIHKLEQNIQML